MKLIKLLLFIAATIIQETSAQKFNFIATYAKSDLIFSPGLELHYFFNDKLGVTTGLSALLYNYKPNQIANQTPINEYNTLFYNGNIGLCGALLNYKKIKLGWISGLKWYYGREFIPLYFYEQGDYHIYFDTSGTDLVGNKFDFGLDMGVLLYAYKPVFGVKYDTARNQIRFLVGWSF